MGSASDNPEVVDSYIDDEVTKGRLIAIRPEDTGSIPAQVSPFGVIPKKSQPGKWRLIVDLSSPHNSSVNDGIAPAICSMSYPSVHDAARIAHSLGPGALLAKIDLQSATRQMATSCTLERPTLFGLCSVVWLKVRPKDLLSSSRCSRVGHAPAWNQKLSALPRRLPIPGFTWHQGVR